MDRWVRRPRNQILRVLRLHAVAYKSILKREKGHAKYQQSNLPIQTNNLAGLQQPDQDWMPDVSSTKKKNVTNRSHTVSGHVGRRKLLLTTAQARIASAADLHVKATIRRPLGPNLAYRKDPFRCRQKMVMLTSRPYIRGREASIHSAQQGASFPIMIPSRDQLTSYLSKPCS